MWKILDSEEWQIETQKKNLSIFYNIDYLKIISETYNLKITLMGYEQKKKSVSLIAFFSKNNNIIVPEGFSYCPFNVDKNIAEQTYFDICDSLILNLKSNFKKIYFKLDIDFYDVRPFIWNDFKIEIKYTHIKKDQLPPHHSIIKNLSKINSKEFKFILEEANDQSIELNTDFLKQLGSSPNKIYHYRKIIEGWSNCGYLKAFSLYKGINLVSSNLILMDIPKKKVYTILLNNGKTNEKFGHTLLYFSQLNWCYENGFREIDFCGANILGISVFKSFFNTELKMYFKLSYHPITGFIRSKWKIIFQKMYLSKGYVLNILKIFNRQQKY